ncbi:MAG: hypothetical protein HY741_12085 [Chloroflexi bacterium]|nr:hypothetical protein [Chloroflexota bacterium]
MNYNVLNHLVRLQQNPEFPNIYDVELENVPALRAYESVEVHLVLYPFSRQIISDTYKFYPFEEYANEISTRRRSVYSRVPQPANSLFGIFLGIVIILFFLAIKPSEVASLQSFVAILGAYFIGKDLWQDIEALFVNVSKDWRVRYQTGYYAYQLERNTTLTHYSALAREQRYGKASLLPERMEFISSSNSKTARLKFSSGDLRRFEQNTAHILAIRLDPAVAAEFASAGYMFSVKLSLNERGLLWRYAHEFFQSLNAGQRGCLDFSNEWTNDAAHAREATFIGNLRYLASQRLGPAITIVRAGAGE